MGTSATLVQQLQTTLGKLEIVLSVVSDGIAWTDEKGVVQWCNAAVDRLAGKPHIENLGVPLIDLLPLQRGGLALTSREHPVNRALQGRDFATDRYTFVAGTRTLTVEITWSRVSLAQNENGVVFLMRDITELERQKEALLQSDERYRLLVESVRDYAIFLLDPQGLVATWNTGAQRIKGYRAEEIIGQNFSRFYREVDARAGKPRTELQIAAAEGRYEDEGLRVRKDGSEFWANVVITAVRDHQGKLIGYSKITRDLSERKRNEDALRTAKAAAEAFGRELEAFSYSVAHDLRAPLRAIEGFSKVLLDKYAKGLDEDGKDYLQRVRDGSLRMGKIIDDLLGLSRLTRAEMRRELVDLSLLAREVAASLRQTQPDRAVEFTIAGDLRAEGDPGLLRAVLENLLGNAWKYTSKHPRARIEFGATQREGRTVYSVRDDGAGFDMAHVKKLFAPFSRLHGRRDFEGSGIGLATVQRIIQRHEGRIWGEGEVERGATFYFSLWEERHEQEDTTGGG